MTGFVIFEHMVAYFGALCYDNQMKKRDFILIIIVLLAAGTVWFVSSFFTSETGEKIKILVDNQVFGIYDLNEEQEIMIADTNICRIENGRAIMEYADCPDQVCVHASAISKHGQTIICMPNRVVLEVINGTSQNEIDTIVR